VVTIVSLEMNVDFLLLEVLDLVRWKLEVGGKGRLMTFPSGALGGCLSWKLDLTLYVGLGGSRSCGDGDVSIRRRENTEGNRYAGVKVQIAGALAREVLLRCLSTTRRGLLLLRKKGEEKKRLLKTLVNLQMR
jgi:hypothetical protein